MLTVYCFFIMEARCKYVDCVHQASSSIKKVVFQAAQLVILNMRAVFANVKQIY